MRVFVVNTWNGKLQGAIHDSDGLPFVLPNEVYRLKLEQPEYAKRSTSELLLAYVLGTLPLQKRKDA